MVFRKGREHRKDNPDSSVPAFCPLPSDGISHLIGKQDLLGNSYFTLISKYLNTKFLNSSGIINDDGLK